MNHFSIRDIENLCGIKAHTLRTWEQRYRIFCPKRKSGNHRFYNCEDLKDLLRISFLYNSGYKISAIAKMSRPEMNTLISESGTSPGNYPAIINKLTEAAADYDEARFSQLLDKAIRDSGIEICIREIFYPLLKKIGLLWLTSEVIPAQEHFCSNLIRNKLINAIDKLPRVAAGDRKVMIFGLPEEFHEIPLLTACYYFRKFRIPYTYLGLNVSTETVSSFYHLHPATHFYTHAITNFSSEKINETLSDYCGKYRRSMFVLSGPAAACISVKFPNLYIIDSAEGVINFANELSA